MHEFCSPGYLSCFFSVGNRLGKRSPLLHVQLCLLSVHFLGPGGICGGPSTDQPRNDRPSKLYRGHSHRQIPPQKSKSHDTY